MTDLELQQLRESIIQEVIGNLSLHLNVETDYYGISNYLEVDLRHKGLTVASESVRIC